MRVKKQHFLPSQCLLDLFPPYIPHIAPNMAPYEAFLWVGLKVFQVLKSNSFADPSTNWVQKTALPPKPTFPWPFLPHTSHTLPLTWHHTKLFCGLGSKLFQVLNFNFVADPSTNWGSKNRTSSQANVSLTSFPHHPAHCPQHGTIQSYFGGVAQKISGFEIKFLSWRKHELNVKAQHLPFLSLILPLTWHNNIFYVFA